MIPDVPYRFTIQPLPEDEGGGYLIEFPDLPGCMSDGATIEGAITKVPTPRAAGSKQCAPGAFRSLRRPAPERHEPAGQRFSPRTALRCLLNLLVLRMTG
jgi:antitoxin HicB